MCGLNTGISLFKEVIQSSISLSVHSLTAVFLMGTGPYIRLLIGNGLLPGEFPALTLTPADLHT